MALSYWFSPPGRRERRVPVGPRGSMARLFGRLETDQGLSLIRRDGVYSQVPNPDPQTDYVGAERIYLGGHRYLISPTEADDLTSAGYGEWVTEANGYGSGPYGDGPFGGV